MLLFLLSIFQAPHLALGTLPIFNKVARHNEVEALGALRKAFRLLERCCDGMGAPWGKERD